VRGGLIEELIPSGGQPTAQNAAVFDAGDHVVLPGLINTHHHFYQTLTRATPEALDRPLFGWLTALYSIW
jgi:8-oxoguanine deaminase